TTHGQRGEKYILIEGLLELEVAGRGAANKGCGHFGSCLIISFKTWRIIPHASRRQIPAYLAMRSAAPCISNQRQGCGTGASKTCVNHNPTSDRISDIPAR